MEEKKIVKEEAEKIFEELIFKNINLNADIIIVDPIPILGENLKMRGWMIAAQSGDQLVGYLQLSKELEFLRFSSFQRNSNSLEGCPFAKNWLEPKTILEKAISFAGKKVTMSEPYLSFHHDISRLSWIIPAETEKKVKYKIYVVGDYVFD